MLWAAASLLGPLVRTTAEWGGRGQRWQGRWVAVSGPGQRAPSRAALLGPQDRCLHRGKPDISDFAMGLLLVRKRALSLGPSPRGLTCLLDHEIWGGGEAQGGGLAV